MPAHQPDRAPASPLWTVDVELRFWIMDAVAAAAGIAGGIAIFDHFS